jgi:hypothetical protein
MKARKQYCRKTYQYSFGFLNSLQSKRQERPQRLNTRSWNDSPLLFKILYNFYFQDFGSASIWVSLAMFVLLPCSFYRKRIWKAANQGEAIKHRKLVYVMCRVKIENLTANTEQGTWISPPQLLKYFASFIDLSFVIALQRPQKHFKIWSTRVIFIEITFLANCLKFFMAFIFIKKLK